VIEKEEKEEKEKIKQLFRRVPRTVAAGKFVPYLLCGGRLSWGI